MRFKKIYIEITNVCNLKCKFCKGTKRAGLFMEPGAFENILKKIKPYTSHVYLHVMGEPLLHRDLGDILEICRRSGLAVNITTNGTLIEKRREVLLNSPAVRQINFSLHSENEMPQKEYLEEIIGFSKIASEKIYIALRMWSDRKNYRMIQKVTDAFGYKGEIPYERAGNGIRIYKNIFIQAGGGEFIWPSDSGARIFNSGKCYGLKDHIGILADGVVVPCCLDGDGALRLGNIFNSSLEEILSTKRAVEMRNGFRNGIVAEDFCKTCGFAARLNQ